MDVMIDPPSGWMFGFPKRLTTSEENPNIKSWLLEQGYPQKLIDEFGDAFYVRMWNVQ